MAERLVVLVVVLALASAFGLVARGHERRVRRRGFAPVAVTSSPTRIVDLADGVSGGVVVLGTKACSTCARTHAVLREAAAARGEVQVDHVLLEDRPDLVAALDIRTAPTVLLLDAAGVVVGRHPGGLDAAGARDAVVSLLAVTR